MKQIILIIIAALASFLLPACSESVFYGGLESDGGTGAGAGNGQGGSMARFALHGDYLYTVDESTLKVFDLSIPDDPHYLRSKDQYLQAGAETIFTLGSLLFIGSQNGMYIYNIANPEFPAHLSTTLHVKSCDPVVATATHAYVTLNSSNTWCGVNANLLQVYDISDPRAPRLLAERPLFAPRGLAISGTNLFVCDTGLKVFDITDPLDPVWSGDLDHIREIEGIDTHDVIALPNSLLVIGSDGLYQFDHSGPRLSFISKIDVKKD
jgi:hypothetical protein